MELMQNLLLLDQIRGEDSTGVFTVMQDGNLTITKVGSHPMHLFSTAVWGKHRTKAIANGRIMIGHNRKATMGGINSANAHPFHEENIVLVHNGTLRSGHKALADTEVDSHAVCHAFAKDGAESVLTTLDAAFAFIWWDIEKQRLFAVRNTERPLSIVSTEDYHILCSESWMAEALLKRAGKKVEDVIDLPAGRLFEFQLNGTFSSRDVEIKRPVATAMYTGGSWSQGSMNAKWDDIGDDLPGKPTIPSTKVTSPSGIETQQTATPFNKAANVLVNTSSSVCTLVTTPHVTNPDYVKGENVLLKIYSTVMEPSKLTHKLVGKIIEPGKPDLDFIGYLPESVGRVVVADLMSGEATGTIKGFSRSNCGDSAWISGIEKSPVVKVYNTDVATKVWEYVYKRVMCSTCASPIHACEADFTTVSKQKKNEYRVKCADCIETSIPEGELRNVFVQRRLDALQAAQSVSPPPVSGAVSLVKEDSTTTLH